MSFQQGLSGLNAVEQEPRGDRQQHRQRQHRRLQGLARRVRRRVRQRDRRRRQQRASASASPSPRWRSSSRRATSRPPTTRSTSPSTAAASSRSTQRHGDVSYTRNGQFKVDSDGFIVNNQRQQLMGYPADATGTIHARRRPRRCRCPPPASRRRSTTDDHDGAEPRRARRRDAAGAGAPIDFADPTTYNNATSLTVYDAKGQDVALTYYFQKAATDTWNVYVDRQRHADRDRRRGNPAPSTTLTFPANGGTPTAPAGTGRARHPVGHQRRRRDDACRSPASRSTSRGATQFGSQFGVTDLAQDGYAAGPADRRRDRGRRHRHGALLERPDASRPARSSSRTSATRRACSRSAATPGRAPSRRATRSSARRATATSASLQAGALEESNVDLTAELVDMITAQRVYQANAQTIKTQDQVLQTLVNLR